MPALPATWASNPGRAARRPGRGDRDRARPTPPGTPLECIQLQGGRGQVVATDARQLLVRSGYSFPWADDLLIKARPIFGCRALPRDQPVEVGRTDTHVFLRVGPWTISCVIQKELRFPAVERVIPAASEITTRLRLDPADARFLESSLGRLPGGDENNSPVTVDLNGEIAVRSAAPDQPNQVTEVVLNRSSLHRLAVVPLHESRAARAGVRLGYTEIGFTGVESPFVCRDGSRVYAVQPLSGGSVARGGRRGDPHRVGRGEQRRGPDRRRAPRPRGAP